MRGRGLHIWIFFIALLLQSFLFDNLTISTLLVLHIYPIFILSLPINTPQIKMLFLSLLLGVALDVMCGGLGLYTICCVASGVFRWGILKLILGYREVIDGARPSSSSLESSGFFIYVLTYMILHMGLFIGIDSIGIENINFVILKYITSLGVSTIFVLLLLRATSDREVN